MEETDDDIRVAEAQSAWEQEPWTVRERPAGEPMPLSTVGELPTLPQWR